MGNTKKTGSKSSKATTATRRKRIDAPQTFTDVVPRAPRTPIQLPPRPLTHADAIQLADLLMVTRDTIGAAAGSKGVILKTSAETLLKNRAAEIGLRIIARNPFWLRRPDIGALDLIDLAVKHLRNHPWVKTIPSKRSGLLINSDDAMGRLVVTMLGRHSTTLFRLRSYRSNGNLDSLASAILINLWRCNTDAEKDRFIDDWVEAFRDQLQAEGKTVSEVLDTRVPRGEGKPKNEDGKKPAKKAD